jgi:hypothetical protein
MESRPEEDAIQDEGFILQTRAAEERAAQGRRQEARFEIARCRCDPWMNGLPVRSAE